MTAVAAPADIVAADRKDLVAVACMYLTMSRPTLVALACGCSLVKILLLWLAYSTTQ